MACWRSRSWHSEIQDRGTHLLYLVVTPHLAISIARQLTLNHAPRLLPPASTVFLLATAVSAIGTRRVVFAGAMTRSCHAALRDPATMTWLSGDFRDFCCLFSERKLDCLTGATSAHRSEFGKPATCEFLTARRGEKAASRNAVQEGSYTRKETKSAELSDNHIQRYP